MCMQASVQHICVCELPTVCLIPAKSQRVLGNMLIFKAGFALPLP